MKNLSFLYIFLILLFNQSILAQPCLTEQDLPIEIPSEYHLEERENISYSIQTVVHLVLSEESLSRISNQQVYDQISALNRDFNQQNIELNLLPESLRLTAANPNITFCLATKTPSGEPTIGITRTTTYSTEVGLSEDIFYSAKGGHDPWSSDQYLNIWVVDLPQWALGFSSNPNEIGLINDGVVINSRVFGIKSSASPFLLGRTLVHETGHYLGLVHPWGHAEDECEEDDGIADTPLQEGPHRGCPPKESMACESEMPSYWNFMDYTNDDCLALFTKDQVNLMHYVLKNQRLSLINAVVICNDNFGLDNKELDISIYPNPAINVFIVDWSSVAREKNISFNLLKGYDSFGREIIAIPLHKNRSRIEITTTDLPRGMLFVSLTTTEGETYPIEKVLLL